MTDPLAQLQAAAAGGDVDAQLRYGAVLARQGDAARAARWYQRAAASGLPAARRELGLLQLFGLLGTSDVAAGTAALQGAEADGDADAGVWLAQRALITGTSDPARDVMDRLRRAADCGHGGALRSLALIAASHARPRDARTLMAQAAAAGDRHARRLLPDVDADVDADAADAAVADLAALTVPPPHVPSRLVHCESPRIFTCDDVFSALDCRHLIELGRDRLQPSIVVDPNDGRVLRDAYRSSSSTDLGAWQEDPWAVILQQRLCHLLGRDLACAEPLALLRYQPGQEYRPHRDYLPPSVLTSPQGRAAGQRAHTVFVYLSDVEAGGSTAFPELGVEIRPLRGRAVVFDNLHADGTPDPRTLHAGLPVEAGEKWLGTLWLRERSFRA